MINLDYVIKEETKEHDPNWPLIPGYPYIILIIRDSGLVKTISLFKQPDIIRFIYRLKIYMLKVHMKQNINS